MAELAASQHGVFSRSQAADLQLSNKRLAGLENRGTIRRLSRDLFAVTAAPATWCQAIQAVGLAGLVISHRSAAELHRLDGFSPTGSLRIHGSAPRQLNYKSLQLGPWSLAVHRITQLDHTMTIRVGGVRATNVAVTLVLLGLVLDESRLEKALDSAIRNGVSERWIAQTAAELAGRGMRGSRPLNRVLGQPARSGALPDSWFERKLDNILTQGGLPPLHLQYQLGRYRIDGAWPEVNLGIEAHSRQFHFGRQAESSDQRRDLEIASQGWELLYVTWQMLENPADLVARIRAVYDSRSVQFN